MPQSTAPSAPPLGVFISTPIEGIPIGEEDSGDFYHINHELAASVPDAEAELSRHEDALRSLYVYVDNNPGLVELCETIRIRIRTLRIQLRFMRGRLGETNIGLENQAPQSEIRDPWVPVLVPAFSDPMDPVRSPPCLAPTMIERVIPSYITEMRRISSIDHCFRSHVLDELRDQRRWNGEVREPSIMFVRKTYEREQCCILVVKNRRNGGYLGRMYVRADWSEEESKFFYKPVHYMIKRPWV